MADNRIGRIRLARHRSGDQARENRA
jgi:hypothetical protein